MSIGDYSDEEMVCADREYDDQRDMRDEQRMGVLARTRGALRIKCPVCRQRPRLGPGNYRPYQAWCECNEDYDAPSVGEAATARKALSDWAFGVGDERMHLKLTSGSLWRDERNAQSVGSAAVSR